MFHIVRRSKQRKTKLMLLVDNEVLDALRALPPSEISVQEKIRQVLRNFVEDNNTKADDLEDL